MGLILGYPIARGYGVGCPLIHLGALLERISFLPSEDPAPSDMPGQRILGFNGAVENWRSIFEVNTAVAYCTVQYCMDVAVNMATINMATNTVTTNTVTTITATITFGEWEEKKVPGTHTGNKNPLAGTGSFQLPLA